MSGHHARCFRAEAASPERLCQPVSQFALRDADAANQFAAVGDEQHQFIWRRAPVPGDIVCRVCVPIGMGHPARPARDVQVAQALHQRLRIRLLRRAKRQSIGHEGRHHGVQK